ncbi:RHS repeat domain-containing protein [Lysobacter enzymogenes]|uniref:RHS repeat domain-containing protein n=1 Tax=Lysobacter enzymogenes TaxID=69 RepID=UPI0019CF95EE|nr:RHS repeat-associated core domain-containing protein [Lysobacter enzymogenes]
MKRNILKWISAAGLTVAALTAQAQTVVEYIHTDALGSPVAVTDAKQNVVERSEYEPYGRLINRPLEDGPGYTGHVSDAQTGLSYMQQRYYDQELGRFVSVDPVPTQIVKSISFNRYWYAAGNPYKFVDPDGRYVCSGGKADCDMFDKAMDKARSAATNPRLTTDQRAALQKSVNFYGEKGKEGVTVKFGPVKTGYAMTETNEKGIGNVTFDLAQIVGKSVPSDLAHGVAMRALHEGDHGARIVESGYPATRADRMNREVHGYWAEAYYQKANEYLQNGQNIWAPWNPGEGFDEKLIQNRARRSVESACGSYTGGNC